MMPNMTWVPAAFDSLCRPKTIGIKRVAFRRGHYSQSEDGRTVCTEDRIITVDPERFSKCDTATDYGGDWTPRLLQRDGLRTVMFNALTVRNKTLDLRDRGVDVIIDSGGFQLGGNRLAFIDPRELAATYNRQATHGVALDLPVVPEAQDELISELAVMQRRNNEIIKPLLSPGVHLMNVSHGFNLTSRKAYLREVYDPTLPKLAVAGLIRRPPQDVVAHMMWLLTTLGSRVDHYHLLGISGAQVFVVLAYLAKLFPGVQITCDSSTYAMRALNTHLYDPTSFSDFRFMGGANIGDRRAWVDPSMVNPCSCHYCAPIKYIKPALDAKCGLLTVWVLHNMRETCARVDRIRQAVSVAATPTALRPFLHHVHGAPLILRACALADRVLAGNKEQRANLLSPWFATPRRSLFGTGRAASPRLGQYRKVLATYEAFHKEHGIQ